LSYLFFGNQELNNLIPETLIRLTRYTSSVTQDPTLLYPYLNTIMLFSLGEEMYNIYNLIDNLTIFLEQSNNFNYSSAVINTNEILNRVIENISTNRDLAIEANNNLYAETSSANPILNVSNVIRGGVMFIGRYWQRTLLVSPIGGFSYLMTNRALVNQGVNLLTAINPRSLIVSDTNNNEELYFTEIFKIFIKIFFRLTFFQI